MCWLSVAEVSHPLHDCLTSTHGSMGLAVTWKEGWTMIRQGNNRPK
jgi:hypothetical protein